MRQKKREEIKGTRKKEEAIGKTTEEKIKKNEEKRRGRG